ncbi:VRR-NUC domain-containing protein [Pseudomonas schmalbachii]|uniref:phosphodiesterase I n=1 Tax=Pseudomonas schmalbachii TaxID=2816993 RepID=A0ABS3TW13_9PSED|nr:VRR-NUC domain-containing protein [Pseudomonas schmalbachii]MBO3277318.1 VRR-NUC domain-containing protein [Pseudomonas schmalbachii]
MPLPPVADFYYLTNFLTALDWIEERHEPLLLADERDFIGDFLALEQPSQALLVRLVMRKGPHFRASKLNYAEIGCTRRAAAPLLELGWISDRHELAFAELLSLLRKDELVARFRDELPSAAPKKGDLAELLAHHAEHSRSFAEWYPDLDDPLYSLVIGDLCDRLRLLFFGNLRQDWSEFVLADLGVYRYEQVPFSADSRAFRNRADLDGYLHLWRCGERFAAGLAVDEVVGLIGEFASDNPFLQSRHARLLFRLAQQLEREGELEGSLRLYQRTVFPGSRQRQIRVLERLARLQEAHELAQMAANAPESEAEAQLVERALVRLNRLLGLPRPARASAAAEQRFDLCLPPMGEASVELCVRDHLNEAQAPVHYVENTLINSLFGLLCWEAIFAPLPGAFFHPFHAGPADLLSADFAQRRAELFASSFALIDSGEYASKICRTWHDKFGIVSPFVYWDLLDAELLEQALACLPAVHLKAWFERLLLDIKANRAGMPDLIQFWPAEQRYRMIEVKGPGDRLQDNQKRWLAFCAEHGMPVEVCYVTWADEGSAP